jgi:hypothetical protein
MAIADAVTAKKEALAGLESDIRWGISSVYNKLWQENLTVALDEAVQAATDNCILKEGILE